MSSTAKIINKAAHPFSRLTLETLLSRRFFYVPAFEIYGGVYPQRFLKGLQIYDPRAFC